MILCYSRDLTFVDLLFTTIFLYLFQNVKAFVVEHQLSLKSVVQAVSVVMVPGVIPVVTRHHPTSLPQKTATMLL